MTSRIPVAAGATAAAEAVAPGSPRFNHLTTADGLSTADVRAIAQDHQGFMWFGTWLGGLDRYDGYTFKVYKHDDQDEHTIGSDTVRTLFVDHAGVLWASTFGPGLDRYNPETDSFIHYRHRADDPSSLPDNNVTAINEDEAGALWVGTPGGLSRFDRTSGTFFTYTPNPNDPASLGKVSVQSIGLDSTTGLLWIGVGSNGGVRVLDRSTGHFTSFVNDPGDSASLSNSTVYQVFQDRAGTMWLATQAGLDRFDRKTNTFVHYRHDAKNPNSLSDDYVQWMCEDQAGRFWVATNNGLNLMDRATGTFTRYMSDPNDPDSPSSNVTNYGALYADTVGAVWIGTRSTGVDRVAGEAPKFATYRHKAQDANSLSSNAVAGIDASSAGDVWIGTEAGLDRFDGRTFTHYVNDPNDPGSITQGPQRSVVKDAHGVVWTGTYGGGLDRLDGQHFVHYRHDPQNPDSPANDNISNLVADPKGGIWIGAHGAGIDYFDGQHFTHYAPDPKNPDGLQSPWVVPILVDQRGMLWIASSDSGLIRLDPSTGKFTTYLMDPTQPGSQAVNWTQDVYFDGAVMWVGASTGLFRFDPTTGAFTRHYTEKDGLASNSCVSVVGDTQGHLWVGTVAGLSRFDPKTETFRNYDVLDGLQSNAFSFSRARAPDGRLFFGGVDGFNAFYPDKLLDNPTPPPVVLTDFDLFNKPVEIGGKDSPLQQAITVAPDITLRYDQSVFRIQFAALNYTTPGKNAYAYKLDGFDRDWVYSDATRRSATYTNLSPGDYVFRVKASNNDGVWNEQGIAVKITIVPPWWETWWFRILLALALIALGVGAYRYRVGSLRQRNRVLESQVAQRTHELEVAKDAAEGASLAKTAFLANMSHELRSPLTAMLGQTERLIRRQGLPDDVRGSLAVALRSGDHLRTLINQVLDLSMIEAGAAVVQEAPFDLAMLASGLEDTFGHSATAKGVRLRIDVAPDVPRALEGDGLKLRQVLINLLGNAIKFTAAGEVAITVRRAQVVEAATGQTAQPAEAGQTPPIAGAASAPDSAAPRRCRLVFTVQDTGAGIAEDELPKLFGAFTQAEAGRRAREGTGLGLAISRTYVELMGGELRIQSKLGEGTTLTFELPFAIAEAVPRQSAEIPAAITLASGQHVPRILVTDDDGDSRETYVRFLTSIGVAVREAADGNEAAEVAAAESPDLIFMDIRMPVMGGIEAARLIRSRGAPQPVIVAMTASVFMEQVPEILAAGCDDFLLKPFSLDKLVAMMETHLGTRFIRSMPGEQPTDSERLAASNLPAVLREQLASAIDSLEVEAIDVAIAQIRELDAALGDLLASYARDYRYGAIISLVRPPSLDSAAGTPS